MLQDRRMREVIHQNRINQDEPHPVSDPRRPLYILFENKSLDTKSHRLQRYQKRHFAVATVFCQTEGRPEKKGSKIDLPRPNFERLFDRFKATQPKAAVNSDSLHSLIAIVILALLAASNALILSAWY